jgi:hypothetical protein
MATNKAFLDENAATEAKPAFIYWKCPGKWAENSYGEKRRVCSGRLYTDDSRCIGSTCPVCGTDLIFIQTNEPKEEAVKCATAGCIGCKKREKSLGVAEGCVGGYKYEGHARRNIYGTSRCNGCLCVTCCEYLRASAEDIYRLGMNKYAAARRIVSQEIEKILSRGKITLEEFKTAVKAINSGLSDTAGEWEALEAMRRL